MRSLPDDGQHGSDRLKKRLTDPLPSPFRCVYLATYHESSPSYGQWRRWLDY